MAHTCDGTLSTLYQQGQQGAILSWFYTDLSSGAVIQPTTPTVKLFDPNDIQRNLTNTAQTTGVTVTPTLDSSGAVTGSAGKYYVTVNFDAAALVSGESTWYVQTQFTWENVTSSRNICFNLVAAGAGISLDGNTTNTSYATVQEVAEFMTVNQFPVDVNSIYSKTIVERYIKAAEDELDMVLKRVFRSKTVTDDMRPISWNVTTSYWVTNHFGEIHLPHRNVQAITKLEIMGGTDFLDITANQGRNKDWYLDPGRGKIYLRRITWPVLQPINARISYVYGEPTSTLPYHFKMAVIMRASWYILQSDDYSVLLPEGGDGIRQAEKSMDWSQKWKEMVLPYRRGLVWS